MTQRFEAGDGRRREQEHYAGPNSKAFWRRVNRLPSPHSDALYSLGCVLQNIEGYVLNQLRNAEVLARTEKRTKVKR